MSFNFNIGAVKVTYQTSSGAVKEKLIFDRINFNYLELHYTIVDATQTNFKTGI
jgi:hypothetical protein